MSSDSRDAQQDFKRVDYDDHHKQSQLLYKASHTHSKRHMFKVEMDPKYLPKTATERSTDRYSKMCPVKRKIYN